MNRRKISPMEDLTFKKIFGSPKYSHILAGLVKDFLGIDEDGRYFLHLQPFRIDTYQDAIKMR